MGEAAIPSIFSSETEKRKKEKKRRAQKKRTQGALPP
jgi:hypothetical protein